VLSGVLCGCTCRDFIQVYNRCWLVQLMPESWHQISLSSGWMGATAGGPAAAAAAGGLEATTAGAAAQTLASVTLETGRAAVQSRAAQADGQNSKILDHVASPQQQQQQQQQEQQQQCAAGVSVSMSSSWSCNPQFRLSVAGNGNVIVCLGQRDPQVWLPSGDMTMYPCNGHMNVVYAASRCPCSTAICQQHAFLTVVTLIVAKELIRSFVSCVCLCRCTTKGTSLRGSVTSR
jgi:hypothetical protein